MNTVTDLELLDRSSAGDREAFGQIVQQYQTLICSIAYSVVGDFARSEDIGQDAFITAWKQLAELRDRSKFKAWICAITRNLAVASLRGKRKGKPLDEVNAPLSADPSPEQLAVSNEEQRLVWSALEHLPESYREPLVLYYRQDHSVGDVADALELSTSAVKQRLARGREMLREEVTAIIEQSLKRTVPTAAFTAAVLSGLTGLSAGTASAAAIGAVGKASPTVVAAIKTGVVGSIAGSLIGLAGAAFGTWASWQGARYQRERDWIVRQIIVLVIVMAIYAVPLVAMNLGWKPWQYGPVVYAVGLLSWMMLFFGFLGFWIWTTQRQWKRVVAKARVAREPRLTETSTSRWLHRWKGRRWTSRWRLCGLPLVQIAMSDPRANYDGDAKQQAQVARAWVAIGDRAYGVVLAMGTYAIGTVALGGPFSVGIISLGAIPVGLISFGGFAIGLLAIGGLSMGGYALAGCAIGWNAIGGAAIAWQAAKGGFAVARDYALGGFARANFANDAIASEFFASSAFFRRADQFVELLNKSHDTMWDEAILVLAIGVSLLVSFSIMYRRSHGQTEAEGEL